MELNLKDIVSLLLSKLFVIILVVLFCAGVGFAYTYFAVDPTYAAYTKLVVRNREGVATGVTSSDLAASQSLVNTCMKILETEDFLDQVSAKLESKYTDVTNSYIKKHMTCKHITDTEIFVVQITTTDPNLSYDIANAISDLAPELIPKTITVGELRLIDRARIPTTSSWPITRNTVLGGLVGAVLAIAVIIIRDMLDTTIRTKKDLEDRFEDIPVIGTIPGIKQR